MKKTLIALLILGVAGLAGFALYRRIYPPHAKNLLLITVDALRSDHLGAYGYPLDQKNISAFAGESLVYDNAFTTIPTTQPAISSIFTSMYPRSHTVRKNGILLPDEALTLAEVFKRNGWKTAAFVSAFPLDRRFKLDQGFDEYRDSIGSKGRKKNLKFEVSGDLMTKAVLKWLNKNSFDSNHFMWIHYFDPHAPYSPPAKFANVKSPKAGATAELNAYDGEIQFLDEQIGILLNALEKKGILKNTLVVLVSDHGEGFGEHGYAGHGWFLYDEVIRVALLMHGPGIHPGRNKALTQHVDLAPGILDYFGIPIPGTFEGTSWWRVLQSKTKPRTDVWVERRLPPINATPDPTDDEAHSGIEEKWAFRTANAKFIWSSDGKHEYYDLSKDPMERNNLYSASNAQAMQLEKAGMELRLRAIRASLAPGKDIQEQDKEAQEGLKSLGYVN